MKQSQHACNKTKTHKADQHRKKPTHEIKTTPQKIYMQNQPQNERLSKLGIEIRSVLTCLSQWSSQPSGYAQSSSREAFISKSEAKTIYEINNICEVIILFMFTCLSLLWLPPAEFYACDISCKSLFVLLLVQSQGLLWTIIHGVM